MNDREAVIAALPQVAEVRLTCLSVPVQLEGRLTDGRWFYFRYRHCRASLTVSPVSVDRCVAVPYVDDLTDGEAGAMLERHDEPCDRGHYSGWLEPDELHDVFAELLSREVFQ